MNDKNTTDARPPTDEELYKRLPAGDREALGELYYRYEARLVHFFFRLGFSRADAEDLAQEVFIRVLETKDEGRARFDPTKGSFLQWLYGIAWNEAKRAWRARRRTGITDLPPSDGSEDDTRTVDPVDPAASPLERLFTTELLAALRECISLLDEEERLAMILWLDEEWSIEAFRDLTGCGGATAFRIKERAFAKLKRCIETKRLLQEPPDELCLRLRMLTSTITSLCEVFAAKETPSDDRLVATCVNIQGILVDLGFMGSRSRVSKKLLNASSKEQLRSLWQQHRNQLVQRLTTEITTAEVVACGSRVDKQPIIDRILQFQAIHIYLEKYSINAPSETSDEDFDSTDTPPDGDM